MRHSREYNNYPIYHNDNVRADVWYPESKKVSAAIDRSFYRQVALTPEQTHSNNIRIVNNSVAFVPDTDALITFEKYQPIGIVTADCVPLLLHAPDIKAIAAIHAGWKGSLGGITHKCVDILITHGADPAKMKAIFGPSISKERYEVDNELATQFCDAGYASSVSRKNPEDKPHIDLQDVNRLQLLGCGLKEENIRLSTECTFDAVDSDGYHYLQSHRRSQGNAGRNLTTIIMG